MTEFELFRRRFLQGGTALGVTSLLPWGIAGASESSPDLEKFVQPLPVPEVREPDGRREGDDYHELELREFERQANLGDEADGLRDRLEEFGYEAIVPESGPGARS